MKASLIASLCVLGIAFAQQKATKPSFEVSVVKPLDPNTSPLVAMSADPTVISYGNITLRDAIRGSFRVRDFQIVAPDWLSSARFFIQGKLPEGAAPDQAADMLQSLLEERFKLETRRETKEMDVYALVVAPGGLKLKPSELKIDSKTPTAMGTDGKPRQVVFFGGNADEVTVTAPGSSFLTFVGVTSRFTARPLVDLTGIDGLYDFKIRFAPENTAGFPYAVDGNPPPAADPAPTLADALKEMGLRIEKRKMPIEMLIVTRMEKVPTEN
jgi:uncharacterized protein (TIGR03435 family)